MRLFTLNGLTQEEDETPNKSQQWRDSCAVTLMTTVRNNKKCKNILHRIGYVYCAWGHSKYKYLRKPLSLSVFTARVTCYNSHFLKWNDELNRKYAWAKEKWCAKITNVFAWCHNYFTIYLRTSHSCMEDNHVDYQLGYFNHTIFHFI